MGLYAFPEVKTPCETCGGKRFKDEVLAYKLNGKSISDVLAMSVRQALDFFSIKEIVRKLQALRDVGLDYLTLGQPLSTLSGGECQRIKLASELQKKGSMYVMDEPTTGLKPRGLHASSTYSKPKLFVHMECASHACASMACALHMHNSHRTAILHRFDIPTTLASVADLASRYRAVYQAERRFTSSRPRSTG